MSALLQVDRTTAARPAERDLPLTQAVLNGVCGDYLEETNNSLAVPMTLLTRDAALELTPDGVREILRKASSRIILLVHGLCLSEASWSRSECTDLGLRSSDALCYTPIYVRYNSGRRVSTNGRQLADLIERLIALWPMRVESVALVGHSMGGLVVRSAAHYAERDELAWRQRLSHVVCLGTPHHGSSLERIGHVITRTMQACPYIEPFALGRIRSAGIQDLRYGNVQDDDWQPHARSSGGDTRVPAPLLDGVTYCFAAATIGRYPADVKSHLLGDLLVDAHSALGAHRDAERHFELPPDRRRVFCGLDHFDLLDHPDVQRQVIDWLSTRRNPNTPERGSGND